MSSFIACITQLGFSASNILDKKITRTTRNKWMPTINNKQTETMNTQRNVNQRAMAWPHSSDAYEQSRMQCTQGTCQ